MKTIKFNPAGGAIIAKAVFLGRMVANYEFFLKQKDSNTRTTLLTGDNVNPEVDETSLPIPALLNEGRRVILETGFCGLDHLHFPNYEIRQEIWQDEIALGFADDTGTLTGKGQYSILFIKLIV